MQEKLPKKQSRSIDTGARPNVIGVGFGKAGTSYIAKVLAHHPEICFSNKKETHYFTNGRGWYHADLSGYSKYFSGYDRTKHKIIAEWSNTYIYDTTALDRIYGHFADDVKILISYRDPVESVISSINYRLMNGAGPRGLSPRQTIDSDPWRYLKKFYYDEHILNVLQRFRPENIYIMHFQEMTHDRAKFFSHLFSFLEISGGSFFDNLPIINYSQVSRNIRVEHQLRRIVVRIYGEQIGREMMRWNPSAKPFWLRVVQGFNTRTRLQLDRDLKRELRLTFEPHMIEFERLIADNHQLSSNSL